MSTLFGRAKDEGARVRWTWGKTVVCFVCLACGWMYFVVNCFPLFESSFCEGFCVSSYSEYISPCRATY